MQTPAFQHTTCSLTPSASTAETCSAFLRPPHLQQVLQWVRSKRNWFCSGRAEGTRVLPWSEQSNETWGTGERNRRLFPLSSPSFQESRITSVPRWMKHTEISSPPRADGVSREGLRSESTALSQGQSGGAAEGARGAALPWLHRPQGGSGGACRPQGVPAGPGGVKEAQERFGPPSWRRGCRWLLRWPQAGVNGSLRKCLRSVRLVRFT